MKLVIVLACVGVLAACGSSGATTADAGNDGGSNEAQADGGNDGGVCCTPDPNPGCCMHYGGWSSDAFCPAVCDGMPQPSDPGWTLATDSHGCSVWSNPKPSGGPGTCGAADIDAGLDAPSD